MKRKKAIFIFLLGIFLNSNAQQQSIYNFEKLVSLTSATEKQQKKLKKALKERSEDYTSASENENFDKRFAAIFNEKQQTAFYKAQISEAVIQKKLHFRYDKLVSTYPFPKDYAKMMEAILYDFNYKKEFVLQKHKFDKEKRELKYNSIHNAQKLWVATQIELIKKATYTWQKTTAKCPDLRSSKHTDFIDYHFYIELSKNCDAKYNGSVKKRIAELVLSESLMSLGENIADCRATLYMSWDSKLKNLDAVAKQEAQKILALELSKELKQKLSASKIFEINNIDWKHRNQALASGEKKQNKLHKTKEIKLLKEKALKIGLDKAQINKLISLLEKKDAAIEALKKKNTSDNLSTLFEGTPRKSKSQILKDFSSELTSVISKKEFAALIGDGLKPGAKKKANKEFEKIIGTHKLTKEQKEKVYERVALYYFNEAVTNAYYKSKSTLRKQKLSVLRYKFEKDYRALMNNFDIKIEKKQKTDNRTFQW